jgi:DNA-directed RNA polymerase specialized sigma24 family protein
MSAVPVPESDVSAAYTSALSHAKGYARGDAERVELFTDAATDAVLWAIAHCNNAGTFAEFARSAVRRFVGRAAHRLKVKNESRPTPEPLPEQVADRDTKPATPLLIEDLPEDLGIVVRLYFVDAYDLREIAMLTGQSFKTVQRKLRRAAELLAEGRIKPERKAGTRRLSKG